jgi:hypothetical protein
MDGWVVGCGSVGGWGVPGRVEGRFRARSPAQRPDTPRPPAPNLQGFTGRLAERWRAGSHRGWRCSILCGCRWGRRLGCGWGGRLLPCQGRRSMLAASTRLTRASPARPRAPGRSSESGTPAPPRPPPWCRSTARLPPAEGHGHEQRSFGPIVPPDGGFLSGSGLWAHAA